MLAGKLKEQGNIAFKAGQLRGARAKYTKALRLADRIFDLESDEQVKLQTRGSSFFRSCGGAWPCTSFTVVILLYVQIGKGVCAYMYSFFHL